MTLTVSDVVEHAFCPNFTYYISVLGLSQYQGKRGTVKAGRQMHRRREQTNAGYIPAGLNGKKIVGNTYHSRRLDLVGRIDEAVVTNDEIVLVERKYSDRTELVDTLRVQLGLLAMLVEENTGKPVRKAIVVYAKGSRVVKEYPVDEDMREFALRTLAGTKRVIDSGAMPDATFDNRCLNCCFRRICPIGSLNTGQ